ncbi:hypothetical protein T10_8132 [Trichinella papuae]|uniref:Uncharacterized protein n=1 Tax=Trichinella papuae TaxID=268474 RepID=A0A0V1N143_9BILA|nr:hypothetical protein T10_8132 [Trichinella papuae]
MTEEQSKLSNRELICFLAGGHSEHFQWRAALAGAERVNEIDEFSNMAPSTRNLPSNLTTPIVSNGAGRQLTLVTVDDSISGSSKTPKRADVQRPGRTSTGVHQLGVTARRSGTNSFALPRAE